MSTRVNHAKQLGPPDGYEPDDTVVSPNRTVWATRNGYEDMTRIEPNTEMKMIGQICDVPGVVRVLLFNTADLSRYYIELFDFKHFTRKPEPGWEWL